MRVQAARGRRESFHVIEDKAHSSNQQQYLEKKDMWHCGSPYCVHGFSTAVLLCKSNYLKFFLGVGSHKIYRQDFFVQRRRKGTNLLDNRTKIEIMMMTYRSSFFILFAVVFASHTILLQMRQTLILPVYIIFTRDWQKGYKDSYCHFSFSLNVLSFETSRKLER